jgi:hypothetical protein
MRYLLFARGRIEEPPMPDKRETPEAAEGASPRKRAVPTIDLTAAEVPRDAAGDEAPPPAEQQATAGPELAAGAPPNESVNWLSAMKGPALAAGFAGAAIMMVVLFGLWLTGLVPIRYAGSTATRARVTALEMQLRDLQSRPAAAFDTKSIEALNARLAKIEEAAGKSPTSDPKLDERIAAAENAMKSLGLALAALSRRSDDIAADATFARDHAQAAEKAVTELRSSVQIATTASAGLSSADLDALQQRIAVLEQSAKTTAADIAKSAATDTAARLALSALALREAAFSGAPLSAALAQVKSLGADEAILAPLAPFATTGVPTQAALAQDLRGLLPAMFKLSGAKAPPSGFLERLEANAGNLVRVRPVDAPAGDDTSAVLARLEIDAAHGDIPAALTDLGKLTEAQRAPAQAWIKTANDRQAALAAARAFAAQTASALGKQ